MPYIQMQISADKFLAMFREGIRAQLTELIKDEFPFGSDVLLIDRVELAPTTNIDDSLPTSKGILWGDYKEDDTGMTDVDATKYVLVQSLTLYPLLLQGTGAPTPTLQTLPSVPATVRIEIDAWASADWVARLFLQPRSFVIDALPVIPGVPPELVAQAVGQVKQRIDNGLVSSSQELGADTPIGKMDCVNAGLAFDPDRTRMAILMQMPNSLEPRVWVWRNFHGRQLDDLLQSGAIRHDWAQTMDAFYFEAGISRTIETGLKEKAGEVKMKQTPPVVNWEPSAGKARLTVFVPIEQNAPDPLAGTVDLDLHADMTWDAIPTDTLQMTIGVNAQVTGASFNLVLLATSGAVLGVTIIAALSFFLFGPLAGLITAGIVSTGLALLNGVKGPSLAPGNIQGMQCINGPVQTHDYATRFTQEIKCTKVAGITFPLDAQRRVRLLLRDVRGFSEAMVSGGVIELPRTPGMSFTLSQGDIHWVEPTFECGSSFMTLLAMQQAGHIVLTARGLIIATPTDPKDSIGILSATLRSADPHGVFIGTTIEPWGAVAVNIFYNAAYLAAPYPFWILLRTSMGTRLLKMDPPPFITDAQKDDLTKGGILDSISDCYAKSTPSFFEYHGVDIKSIPDPPPDAMPLDFLWDIRVRGLDAGEAVQVNGPSGALATFRATSRGEAVFSATLSRALSSRLSLKRVRNQRGMQPLMSRTRQGILSMSTMEQFLSDCDCTRHLEIQQRVLLHRAQVGVRGPLRHLSFENLANTRCLVVVGADDMLSVFDASDLSRPASLCSRIVDGIRGATSLGDSLLVYGEFGALELEWPMVAAANGGCCNVRSNPLSRWRSECWSDSPVHKLRRQGSMTYVQTETALEVLSSRTDRARATVDSSCRDFEIAGNHVYTLGTDSIEIRALEAGRCTCSVGKLETRHATAISTPSFAFRTGYLFVHGERGGQLYDVTDPTRPQLVSSYESAPDWTRAAALRSAIAISDGHDILTLCSLGSARRGELAYEPPAAR